MNVDKLWHCSSSTTTKEYFCYPINKQFIYNSVSVEPSAPQPSPPMPSIRLRTCETWGFLPRRLLRSATSLPAARASGHSGSTTRTLLRNPQDSRAVLRTTDRHSIIAGLQDTYQEPFPQAISSKTASPST